MVVKVYEAPNCGQCMITKRALEKRGIEYEVVNLADNPQEADRLKSMGYQQAPVVETGTETWQGFQPAKINSIHM